MRQLLPLAALVSVALLGAAATFGRRFGRLLAADLVVTCQFVAESLIRFASRRIPEVHRERYFDEWLGELDALRRESGNEAAFSLILFSLRVLVRSGSTGRAVSKTQPALDSSAATAQPEPEPSVAPSFDDFYDYYIDRSSQLHLWQEPRLFQDADFLEALRENRTVRIDRRELERYLDRIRRQTRLGTGQGTLFESFEINWRGVEDESGS